MACPCISVRVATESMYTYRYGFRAIILNGFSCAFEMQSIITHRTITRRVAVRIMGSFLTGYAFFQQYIAKGRKWKNRTVCRTVGRRAMNVTSRRSGELTGGHS